MKRLRKYAIWVFALFVPLLIAEPLMANGCVTYRSYRNRKRIVYRNRFFGIPVAVPVYTATYQAPAPCPNPPAVRRSLPRQAPPAEEEDTDYAPPARRAAPPPRTYSPPTRRAAPPAAYGSDNALEEKMDRLLGVIEGIDQRLNKLETRRAAPAPRGYAPKGPPRSVPRKAPPMPYDSGNDNDNGNDDNDEQDLPPRRMEPLKSAPKAKAERAAVSAILSRSCAMCHDERSAERNGKGFVLIQGGVMVRLSQEDKDAIVAELTGQTMPPRPVPPLVAAEKDRVLRFMRNPKTA